MKICISAYFGALNSTKWYINRLSLFQILLVAPFTSLSGQNYSEYSNYLMFKPLINTAASCEYESFAGILMGRKQWVGVKGAPASLGLQIVQPLYSFSVGGALFQETIGVHIQQRIIVNYSYSLILPSDNKLSFGLGAGGVVLTSNYDEVLPSDWNDDQFRGGNTIVRPDFNFGIFLSGKKYFAGISVPKIVENSIISSKGQTKGHSDYDPLLWTYLLTCGYVHEINHNVNITSATLIKLNLNAPIDTDLGLSLNTEKYGFGVSYRTKSEIIVFANLSLSSEIMFGYCFHNYFNIIDSYLSGHEIYIKYQYKARKQAVSQTPRF